MIALYPDDITLDEFIEFRKKYIKAPEDSRILPRKEIHCTIRYWENNKDKIEDVIELLESLKLKKEYQADPKNIQKLGNSLSLMLKSNDLQKLYKDINNKLLDLDLPDSDYDSYKPHMAFFYSDDVKDKKIIKKYENDVIFDKIKFVDQDDNVIWESKSKKK